MGRITAIHSIPFLIVAIVPASCSGSCRSKNEQVPSVPSTKTPEAESPTEGSIAPPESKADQRPDTEGCGDCLDDCEAVYLKCQDPADTRHANCILACREFEDEQKALSCEERCDDANWNEINECSDLQGTCIDACEATHGADECDVARNTVEIPTDCCECMTYCDETKEWCGWEDGGIHDFCSDLCDDEDDWDDCMDSCDDDNPLPDECHHLDECYDHCKKICGSKKCPELTDIDE